MTRRGALWVTYAIFVTIGFMGAVWGPALENLADQVGSTKSAIGMLITANFLGSWIAQASVGPLMERLGPRPLLLAGITLMTVGTLGILISPTLWVILAVGVVFGIGFGALDTGSNVLIAELYADHNVSVLNSLHFFFGVGSIISPLVAGQALDWWDSAIPAIWLGFVMLLLLWPGVGRLPAVITRPEARSEVANGVAAKLGKFSYRSVLLWSLGVLLMIYVSAEMGLSTWTTQYVEESTRFSNVAGARLTSAYWFALTIGRLAGILWGSRLSGDVVLLISLIGSLVGAVLLAAGSGLMGMTVIGAVVIGFFFGPVYPTVIAIATATFRSGPGKAASLIASMASLGGMVGSPLQGVLLNEVNPVSSVIFVAAQCGGMVILYLVLRRQREARDAQAADPVRAQSAS
ncbi:MAG: MFS transporter [Anaerolineae bacterium]|nr:MFS transporter [Anaerolineae bacterium]